MSKKNLNDDEFKAYKARVKYFFNSLQDILVKNSNTEYDDMQAYVAGIANFLARVSLAEKTPEKRERVINYILGDIKECYQELKKNYPF